jgi:GTP-binding protein EngB required for normal cell division
MPNVKLPLRLIALAILALVLAALLWVLFGALHAAVAVWQELRNLPAWAQYAAAILLLSALAAVSWLALRWLRPRRRQRKPVEAPRRSEVDARIDALAQQRVDTVSLQAELEELDRRARSSELYVAVFGEISAGKSSLIAAIAGAGSASDAAPTTDVLGGTTRAVSHYGARLANDLALTLADVPGTHEVARMEAIEKPGRAQRDDHFPALPSGGGYGVGTRAREQIARDEALRAHIVLYVCAGDLTRDQDAELNWLRGFGKPLVLVLNKADQFRAGERDALQAALRERYRERTDAQVVVSAGGTETFERRLADGRSEHVVRDRLPEIGALTALLDRYAESGVGAFESAREAAVLTSVSTRADVLSAEMRGREANAIVDKYTRRAVVGALAAVMPGSDLVIQAVLATALIRELSKLYDVPVRDIDIDGFLGQVKLTLRTSTSLVLAIAGNAAKAFPGLGTLGGGVLHAIAYGLIFDSLGRAVATTLRDRRSLDGDAANTALAKLLAEASAERLRRIAEFALRGDHDGR